MVSARIWAPALVAIVVATMWGTMPTPPRSMTGPSVAPSTARETVIPPASVVQATGPRATEIPRSFSGRVPRTRAEPLQPLHIAPVNPDLGFTIDRQMLEWLPAGLELRAGDAVLGINGERLVSTALLLDAIRGASEGSAVELRVRRSATGQEVSYWAAP